MKIYKVQSSENYRQDMVPVFSIGMNHVPGWCIKNKKPLFDYLKYEEVQSFLKLWENGTKQDKEFLPVIEKYPMLM
jgi:hypothetical protein